jgi:phosphoribosyl 1,2-cyclic phosphodiesterase
MVNRVNPVFFTMDTVFKTHYHWDHIQGLPFFGAAFREENRFNICGEQKKGTSIQEILSEQMEPPYFLVQLENH